LRERTLSERREQTLAQVTIDGRRVKHRRSVRQVLHEMRREWTAYLFNAPGLIVFAIFTVYSLYVSFVMSFHDWEILGDPKYVGLDNYRKVLTDGEFHEALGHTVYFVIGTVAPTMLLGLGLALLLNSQIKGLGLFRTAYYLPVLTPITIAALLWTWVYEADFGLANYYLQALGIIDEPVFWLANRATAMPAVIVMNIWQGAGFSMLVYLAGLQAVPTELYEAAEVDGANSWQKFRRITLPLLAPTTFFLLVINLVGAVKNFAPIFVMTNGGPPGPGGSTTTVVFYIYQVAFRFFEMGYASALAYTLFVLLFGISFLQYRWYRKRVDI
jgi:multiple sugar transport system permease protein